MSYIDTLKAGLGETIGVFAIYIIIIVIITPFFSSLGSYSFVPATLISITIVHLITNMYRNHILNKSNENYQPVIQQTRKRQKRSKYCMYCGNKIGRGDSFCAACGRKQ